MFDSVAPSHPQARFLWVDIEDEEDLVGDLDVETFPTLLIADPAGARFLGPLLPSRGYWYACWTVWRRSRQHGGSHRPRRSSSASAQRMGNKNIP